MPPWIFALLLAPALTPAEQDQRDLAIRLAKEFHDVASAERLEALLAAGSRDPEVAHIAGVMRSGLNHHAHALRHFQTALAAETSSPAEREHRASLVRGMIAKTALVELRVEPASAATTVVAIRQISEPPPPLGTPVIAGVAAARLDPGEWLVKVDAPGYAPLRQVIEVDGSSAPILIKLEPAPAPAPMIVPAAWVVPPTPVATVDRRGRTETIAGAVLLPLGLVALGGAIAVVPQYQQTRAGVAGVREELLTRECTDADRAALADFITSARHQETAMVALGVTGGVLAVSGAALLADGLRRQRRARVALDVRPGVAGLIFSGKF